MVLVSGDIHVSRILEFPLDDVLTYPMYEFISSPLAEGVALYNDIPSAYLKFSKTIDNVFLKLTVDSTGDSTTLTAEYLNSEQEEPHHRLQLDVSKDLTPRKR